MMTNINIVDAHIIGDLKNSSLAIGILSKIMQQVHTTRCHHSIYGIEMLIWERSEELQRNAPLSFGLDPISKKPVKITTENEATLLPCPREIDDEIDYAELEFHLGFLNEYQILRGPAEVTPYVIKVGQLVKKRTY